MKVFLILFVLSALAFGCNKEKVINRKLKGDWEVTYRSTFWQNGFNTVPQTNEIANWAILSLDKNGEGTLKVYGEEDQPLIVKHFVDGDERFEILDFNGDSNGVFNVTWGWDKKSFQMTQRDMIYGTDNQEYEVFSEVILICKKK